MCQGGRANNGEDVNRRVRFPKISCDPRDEIVEAAARILVSHRDVVFRLQNETMKVQCDLVSAIRRATRIRRLAGFCLSLSLILILAAFFIHARTISQYAHFNVRATGDNLGAACDKSAVASRLAARSLQLRSFLAVCARSLAGLSPSLIGHAPLFART